MIVLGIFLAIVVLFVLVGLLANVLWWVVSTAVIGLVFGALGRLIIPGKQAIGVLATIVCGWIGSLVGGVIGGGIFGWHSGFTFLIELGVSAVAVLAWSAGNRHGALNAPGNHKIIDV